jgi:hypothetical protein
LLMAQLIIYKFLLERIESCYGFWRVFCCVFLPGESVPGEHHATKFETLYHTNSRKGKYSPKMSSVKIGHGSMWGFFYHDYRLMMIAAVSILPTNHKRNERKEKK